jgi:hypothetical protein
MKKLTYLIAVFYFLELFQVMSLGSTGLTLCDFATMAMILLFIKKTIWDGQEIILAKNPVNYFYLIFIIATFLSGLEPLFRGSGIEIKQFLKTSAHFYFTVMFFIINVLTKYKNEDWENFIRIFLIISIGVNIFGAYQIVARAYDLPLAWLQVTNNSLIARSDESDIETLSQLSLSFAGFFRATSIFSEPSALGAFNGLIITFMLIPYIQKQKMFFKSNALNITIFITAVLGIFLAFSLTGLTCVLFTLVTIFIFEKYKFLKALFRSVIIVIIFLIIADQIVFAYSGSSVLELFYQRITGVLALIFKIKAQTTPGETIGIRVDNMISIINIWWNNPLFGTGFGLTSSSAYNGGWSFADITVLGVLAELGIVGFIGFAGIFVTLYIIYSRFLLNREFLKNLPESYQRFFQLNLYVLNMYFVVNYISGNQLFIVHSWILLSIIVVPLNNFYIEHKKSFYRIKLIKKPLKEMLKIKKIDTISSF